MSYQDFLKSKQIADVPTGLTNIPSLNPMLFDWQRDIVAWALRMGRAALFEDCGLGKTPQQLEWARVIHETTGGNVLDVAPLAVADQTVSEGAKFGIEARYCRHQSEVQPGITVINYEMLEHFDPSKFVGVILDESSILKSFMGKTKRYLIDAFRDTPYKLACTATPSPNDHMELGNHAEFLGVMPSNEMLARFFINDTTRVGHYRVKGHAEGPFWNWVASWAVCISSPADLGYDGSGFDLPPLNLEELVIACEGDQFLENGSFLPAAALNATEIHRVMRSTASARAKAAAKLVLSTDEPFIIWCNTDYDADALAACLPGAVEVRGSMPMDLKRDRLRGFSRVDFGRIITKPDIAGFGLNWQHCRNMVFVGLSYSYEKLYQAIRRSLRYGQTMAVNAWVIVTDAEVGVLETIKRKQADHLKMQRAMVEAMKQAEIININPQARSELTNDAGGSQIQLPEWMVA